jgi:hypothetical protein
MIPMGDVTVDRAQTIALDLPPLSK